MWNCRCTRPAQNLVSAHYLVTYDGGGGRFQTYQFPSGVPNGDSQRTILVGATGVSGATPDFVAPTANLLVGAGGSACYIDTAAVERDRLREVGDRRPPTTEPAPRSATRLLLTAGIG